MPHDVNYYKLRCKNLEKENGTLRKKVLNYADKFDFVGSKSIMAECTKWKGKYENLLKTTIGKDKTHYKKRFIDMECECAYYKSKFFDYEYKLKKEIQLSLELKDRSDKLFSEKEDLSTSITNLIKQKIKLEEKLEAVENCVYHANQFQEVDSDIKNIDKIITSGTDECSADSYGYNSMDACIEDMISENPEYPFTDEEKDKILNDACKLVDNKMNVPEDKQSEEFKQVAKEIIETADKDYKELMEEEETNFNNNYSIENNEKLEDKPKKKTKLNI